VEQPPLPQCWVDRDGVGRAADLDKQTQVLGTPCRWRAFPPPPTPPTHRCWPTSQPFAQHQPRIYIKPAGQRCLHAYNGVNLGGQRRGMGVRQRSTSSSTLQYMSSTLTHAWALCSSLPPHPQVCYPLLLSTVDPPVEYLVVGSAQPGRRGQPILLVEGEGAGHASLHPPKCCSLWPHPDTPPTSPKHYPWLKLTHVPRHFCASTVPPDPPPLPLAENE
jgi:hypothetical protein